MIYLACLAGSFLITYLLVPGNIAFSVRHGMIDYPSSRGVSVREVPLAGGLSFGLAVLICQLILYLAGSYLSERYSYLALGGFLIMLLGLFDDKRRFTAKYKLLFQILIIIFIYYAGFKIEVLTNPFGHDIILSFLSLPVTLFWFLLVINAFNLIDGMDGFAAGIGMIASLVLFVVGLLNHNQAVALLSLLLIGSLLAFLRFNFYPARIFMGDTGSLFLGFYLAAISVAGTSQFKGITAMTLLIPIMVLIIPLGDTALAIFRRIKRRRHIFEADKEHLHHKLLEFGFSQKSIALLGYFITSLFGLIALGFSLSSKELLLTILAFLILLLLVFIYILLRKEFWK